MSEKLNMQNDAKTCREQAGSCDTRLAQPVPPSPTIAILSEDLKLMLLNAFHAAVATEREACCKLVYAHASSDNAAERTVRAIRART